MGVAIYSEQKNCSKKKSVAFGEMKHVAAPGPKRKAKAEYDQLGRMKYHADYHPKHKKPWSCGDERYLIENYEKDGPEMVAAALGRTIGVVMTRACELRKAGKMKKRSATAKIHKRIGRGDAK